MNNLINNFKLLTIFNPLFLAKEQLDHRKLMTGLIPKLFI